MRKRNMENGDEIGLKCIFFSFGRVEMIKSVKMWKYEEWCEKSREKEQNIKKREKREIKAKNHEKDENVKEVLKLADLKFVMH